MSRSFLAYSISKQGMHTMAPFLTLPRVSMNFSLQRAQRTEARIFASVGG